MKNFITKMSPSLILKAVKQSIIVVIFICLLLRGYSDSKALRQVNSEIKDVKTNVEDIKKQVDGAGERDKKLEEQIKKNQNDIKSIDRELQKKISYQESISLAIMQTSNLDVSMAYKMTSAIDRVTTEMKKYGYKKDVAKVLAVIRTESDFKNLSPNRVEATGYMQITPSCLEQVNEWTGWRYSMSDMSDMEKNIRVGTYYLLRNTSMYGEEKAIVAYNQGFNKLSSAVNASRGSSNSYLGKVVDRYYEYKNLIGGE